MRKNFANILNEKRDLQTFTTFFEAFQKGMENISQAFLTLQTLFEGLETRRVDGGLILIYELILSEFRRIN